MNLIHICLLFVLTLFGQDGATFMGKVTQITDKSITVQTKDNDHQEIALSKTTRYEKNGAVGGRQDVKIGDRVIIDAEKAGDKLTANIIRFRTEMRLDRRNPKYPFKKDKVNGQNTPRGKTSE